MGHGHTGMDPLMADQMEPLGFGGLFDVLRSAGFTPHVDASTAVKIGVDLGDGNVVLVDVARVVVERTPFSGKPPVLRIMTEVVRPA